MQITQYPVERTCGEREIYESVLALDGKRILELGCGRAELTRLVASTGRDRHVTALEVDPIQHAKNLALTDLPNVDFKLAGAEAIPEHDNFFDVAFMFKSLHHVPRDRMAASLEELRRVLRPGGYAYISEPIFAGRFNDVLKLFHDEREVRAAAFEAVAAAVAGARFELVREIFFNTPVHFENFAAFEQQVIGVTHTRHQLSPALHAEVRARFLDNMTEDGAHFAPPMRVDLLRKPLAVL